MATNSVHQQPGIVQIVGPADKWVLERLARHLAAKLPYAELVSWMPKPGPRVRLAYYINYALFQCPSGLIDVAFFTHLDETQHFLERARRVNGCVCMSKLYADWLGARGIQNVWHIPMGFDSYGFRPRLVLGVVGRLEHPRKGGHLVQRLRELPFVEIIVTEGRMPDADVKSFYQQLDYVLIPATIEGGPMSLLEGLSMGRPVIAPEGVGLVPEFGPSEHILRYPAGDTDALIRVVTACYQRKLQCSSLVKERTWDRWAEGHHQLFQRLLQARGMSLPEPAAGFRFGMLGELEIPWGIDVTPLEEAVDRAAAHLFWGESAQARSALERVLSHFPFARPLLETFPQQPAPDASGTARRRPPPRALR